MTFQNTVNLGPTKGWHGDFASTNSRLTVLGTEGGYQAGSGGIYAGSFVWVDSETQTLLNAGTTTPDGFVGRELTGVTLPYPAETSMFIPAGMMVTVYDKGEFFITVPSSVTEIKRGDVVYVSKKTGQIVSKEDKDAIATSYKYATNQNSSRLIAISAWI